MSIYTKSDQEDIPASHIRDMLIAAEQELEDEAAESDDAPDDKPANPE